MNDQDRTRIGLDNLPLLRALGALFGVVSVTLGLLGVWTGVESLRWPRAPATVVQSERIGAGDHRSSRIVVEYRVGTALRQCGQVRLGRDNRADDASSFAVGARTSVAYDPEVAQECALVPGVSFASLAFLAAGALALAAAAYAHKRITASPAAR